LYQEWFCAVSVIRREDNFLKHHYRVVGLVCMLSAVVVSSYSYLTDSARDEEESQLALKDDDNEENETDPGAAPIDGQQKDGCVSLASDSQTLIDKEKNSVSVVRQNGAGVYSATLTVRKGDTLGSMLRGVNISQPEIEAATKSLKSYFNPKDLKVGQQFEIQYKQESDKAQLLSFDLKSTPEIEISLKRTDKNGFKTIKNVVALQRVLKSINGNVKGDFGATAVSLGMPKSVAREAVIALGNVMQTKNPLKSGAPFEVAYEQKLDKYGNVVGSAKLSYAATVASGRIVRVYSYHPNGSPKSGYYNIKGQSLTKTPMRLPLASSKITSGFGYRTHPIYGCKRHHNGVDFGAPTGTPVPSVGDGVVVQTGRNGNYGNIVRIKHAGGYETLYAHLSKINVRKGAIVRQGQNIGLVGNTGLSTCSHLHLELRKNNKLINPLSIKTLPNSQLNGINIKNFNQFKKKIDAQLVGLPVKGQLSLKDHDACVVNG